MVGRSSENARDLKIIRKDWNRNIMEIIGFIDFLLFVLNLICARKREENGEGKFNGNFVVAAICLICIIIKLVRKW